MFRSTSLLSVMANACERMKHLYTSHLTEPFVLVEEWEKVHVKGIPVSDDKERQLNAKRRL